MKSLIVFVISLMTFSLSIEAQNTDQKSDKEARIAERMAKIKAERDEKLNLTEEQSAELDRINLEYKEKMRADQKETREARMERVKALNALRAEEIKEILDDEQYAKWEEMQQERQARSATMMTRQQERRRGGDDMPSRKDKKPRGDQ